MARLAACVLAAAYVLVALQLSAAQPTASTLQDPKNQGTCLDAFNKIMAERYANDTECARLITQAMNTTVPANCPEPAPIKPTSRTQVCMNKIGTPQAQLYQDVWTNFIRNCEVMYIANRGSNGESEEGFKANDNSCFPRFNSFSDFQAWLVSTSATTGAATKAQAAGGMLLGAALSAFMFMMAL